MKIEIVKFEKLHAYDILDRKVREEDLWLSTQNWESAIDAWYDRGPASTVVIDGDIICCGGVVLLGYQRGEAWMLMSPLFAKYPKTVYSSVKRFLNNTIKVEKLRRVQAISNPDHYKAGTFLEHLGFQCEGVLRKYGPNCEDLLMFSRVMYDVYCYRQPQHERRGPLYVREGDIMSAVALGWAALAVGLGGTAVAVTGQAAAAKKEKQALDEKALLVQREADQKEAAHRKRLKNLMSTQRALYAKAGVDVESGSPLVVLAETAEEGEEEATAIRRGGIETSRQQQFMGRQVYKAGRTAAAGTFLSGLGRAGSSAYALKTK